MLTLQARFSETDCQSSRLFIGAYIQRLGSLGLLPGTPALSDKSFRQVWELVAEMPSTVYLGHHDICGCRELVGIDQRAFLIERLALCVEAYRGLCVGCVSKPCPVHFRVAAVFVYDERGWAKDRDKYI